MEDDKQQPFPAWQERTRVLLGDDAVRRLAGAGVCIVGLGAVGGYVTEAVARAGVGRLRLVDFDAIKPSNINRQLYALHSTVGRMKTDVAAERARDINPEISVDAQPIFADMTSMPGLLSGMDVLVDAVDSLAPKVAILQAAVTAGVPAYSALGAATRRDGGGVLFGPFFSAKGCPLGSRVRKLLRRRGIEGGDLWCVYSSEERDVGAVREPEAEAGEYVRGRRRMVLGSMATVTGLFGLRLAHEVILRLAGESGESGGVV